MSEPDAQFRPPREVYVPYERGEQTGGPEALHQLVHTLRELGVEAFLVPSESSVRRDRVQAYSHYDAPEAPQVVDSPDNAVVVAEVFGHQVHDYSRARCYLWWLSIDNSVFFSAERQLLLGLFKRGGIGGRLAMLRRRIRVLQQRRAAHHLADAQIEHLAQSSYAWTFLSSRLNLTPSPLTDWVVAEGNPNSGDKFVDVQVPVIAYSWTRGAAAAARVIEAAGFEADWRPIRDMTPAQVRSTLMESHVYLDLGHQPGKDRLPREAASAGAIVLMAKQGAGANYVDAPVPWHHKINTGGSVHEAALTAIHSVLVDPMKAFLEQEHYRRLIANERDFFRREVERIFVLGQTGRDFEEQIRFT